MAELADAHGSGPCVGNNVRVQLSLPAPKQKRFPPEADPALLILFSAGKIVLGQLLFPAQKLEIRN